MRYTLQILIWAIISNLLSYNWHSTNETAMKTEEFESYLKIIDHPHQLQLSNDVTSLYILYRAHMTRFPYQNLDLYMGKPKPDLSTSSLLDTMPARGGHCYEHTELLFSVLEYAGFQVSRVACYVLNNQQYRQGMPLTHNIVMVMVGKEHYLCDPGFSAASPRYGFDVFFVFILPTTDILSGLTLTRQE